MINVIEQFTTAKSSVLPSEDSIIVTPSFCSIIDGVTNKLSHPVYENNTPGYLAAQLLTKAIWKLNPKSSYNEASSFLSSQIRQFYIQHKLEKEVLKRPEMRLTASVIIFSLYKREIWFIGDCQCRYNGQTYTNPKSIDQILSRIRTDLLQDYYKKGHSIDSLRANDLGRKFIEGALREEMAFQNTELTNPYSFPVLDGFPIHEEQIKVLKLPIHGEAILASDGYPQIFDTLKESEEELKRINSRDPLCFIENQQTKGIQPNFMSYDDRSFLRFSY